MVAGCGSPVNISCCDHAVVRNLESKSVALLFIRRFEQQIAQIFCFARRMGRASARPRASRRLPLPAAVTPHQNLCVSALKTLNS